MKEHVAIICDPLQDHHIGKIAEAVKGWATWERISARSPKEEIIAKLKKASIVIGTQPPERLKDTPVHTVLLSSVGYDSYEGQEWGPSGIPFTMCNARGVMGLQMGEHLLAMMFALARNLPQDIRDMERKHWQNKQPYHELNETTACLIGIGDIGSEMARQLKAIGMHVIGVRREARPQAGIDEVYSVTDMHLALQKADHVIMITPGGSKTKNLIDKQAFAAMKEGACFYNLGRGSTVEEAALVEALQSGKLRGAGLDVFEKEPLPADSPLWEMRNVIVTPHVAGRSNREYDRMCNLFVENLKRYAKAEPLRNIVVRQGENI